MVIPLPVRTSALIPRRVRPKLLRWCVAHHVLPFAYGAARTHWVLSRDWTRGVPVTFTEKLRYKLIHDRRPLVRVFSDKIASRDYVAALRPELQLPKLLGVFTQLEDLMRAIPPQPWVMKGSHGSGMVLVAAKPGAAPRSEIERRAREWLHTDYALRYWEWHYFRLPKRVIFEEYLGDENGVPPDDYKIFVIHQKVRLITVDRGRFGTHTRNLFRADWSPIPSGKGCAKPAAVPPARPERLDDMIAAAESLGRDTDFVRVDLYAVRGEIYFGELTHTPAAADRNFDDPALDHELGSYWQLPERYQ